MRRLFLALAAIAVVSLASQPGFADADTDIQPFQSSFFAPDSSTDNDLQFFDGRQRPNAERLAIPTNTPTPLEGFRWKKKKVTIYMQTADPKLKWAFKDAVKKWNKTKAVQIRWTKDQDKANIIAADGDLARNSTGNTGVGYTTSELGSTRTEYDPTTNTLNQATSTLDPNQLDYTNSEFRSEVAQHELGHALGLAHAPEYEHSVMIPRNIKTGITKNDAKSLQMLYRD